jgi:GT2 family glycosyltransferase
VAVELLDKARSLMADPATSPVVAVVVSTYQRRSRLRDLLAALERQDFDQPFEVVIIDDGSTDGTAEKLRSLSASTMLDLHTISLSRNSGSAAARNAGWRASRAPLLAFTDDDCLPQPRWLSDLVARFSDADIVQGRVEPNPAQLGRLGPFSHTMRVTAVTGFFETCNIAYRRSILDRCKGFDTAFTTAYGEDADLGVRALDQGARVGYAEGALVYHEVTASSFWRHVRAMKRLDGAARALKHYPQFRRYLHRQLYFRQAHEPALVAAAGLIVAVLPVGSTTRKLALAAVIPYLWHRGMVEPLPGPRSASLAAIPLAFVADCVEMAYLAKAGLRHRVRIL